MTREEALEFRRKIEFAAKNLSDSDALNSIELFPVWSEFKDYVKGDRCRDQGKLYRCYNPITANPTWRPSVTPAHWEEVTVGEDGTIGNPITAAVGMRYYKDKYYKEGDKIYKCIRDDSNGQGTILYYTPSQLVGNYFEEVAA